MTKLSLQNILSYFSGSAATSGVTNNQTIVSAFENTLSRDGTGPNQMLADFDVNGHRILNLPAPVNPTDVVRLGDGNLFRGPKGDQGIPGTPGVNGISGLGIFTLEQFDTPANLAINAAPALQQALNFLSAQGGGTITIGPKQYPILGQNIIVPQYCSIEGGGSVGAWKETLDYSNVPYCLSLGPNVSIKPMRNSAVRKVAIIKNNIPVPRTFLALKQAYEAFSGTAIIVGGLDGGYNQNLNVNDVTLEELFILGFNLAVNLQYCDRFRVDHVYGDCTNGIVVDQCHDTGRMSNCHFWNFYCGNEFVNGQVIGYVGNKITAITAAGDGSLQLTTEFNHNFQVGWDVICQNITGINNVNRHYKVYSVPSANQMVLHNLDGSPATFFGTYNSGSGGVFCAAYHKYNGKAFQIYHSEGVFLSKCFAYGWQTGFYCSEGALWTSLTDCSTDAQFYEDQNCFGLVMDSSCDRTRATGCIFSVGGVYIQTSGTTVAHTIASTSISAGATNMSFISGILEVVGCSFAGGGSIYVADGITAGTFVACSMNGSSINYQSTNAQKITWLGRNAMTIPSAANAPAAGSPAYVDQDLPGSPIIIDQTNKRICLKINNVWYATPTMLALT